MAAAFTAPLTLPTLGNVSRRLLNVKGGSMSARMALALMQIGLLTYRDWAKPWHHESELVERALLRWLRKATAELQIFQFGLTYSDCRQHFTPPMERISFAIYRIGDLPAYTLSTGITELEQATAGLGETALHYLDKLHFLGVPILTPATAFYLAQQTYWQGEDDEAAVLEEELEYARHQEGCASLSPDDIDIYRKSDFLRTIPAWAAEPKARLSLKQLRQIAGQGGDAGKAALTLLRIAALTLLRIAALARRHNDIWTPSLAEEEDERADIAAAFRWQEDDDTGRILDDAMNYIYNAGVGTEEFGVEYLVPEASALKQWLRQAEKLFRLLRAGEQLVRLVGQPVRH